MENFALTTLVEELTHAAAGMVVRRVVGHHAGGFLLQTRTVRIPALKISLHHRQPVIYVSDARSPVDHSTGDFVMALRKHLVSAKLREIHKPLSERVVELEFRTSLPARELETVTLVAELLPNAPNLLLLDSRRRILATYREIAPQRETGEFQEYCYPATRKTDLSAVVDGDLDWFDREAFQRDRHSWLVRNIAGVGPLLAAEVVRRQEASGRDLPAELRTIVQGVTCHGNTVWIYSEKPLSVLLERNDVEGLGRTIVSPIELESLARTHSVLTRPSMLEATRFVFDELETRTLLQLAKGPRLRKLRDEKRRMDRARQRLTQRRSGFEDTTHLQATAQLLVSGGADLDRRQERVEVTDYADGTPRLRTVELDPTRTVRENIARMFKLHRKAGRGVKMIEQQLLQMETTERALQQEESRIRSIGDWNAWHSLLGGRPPSRGRDSRPPGESRQSSQTRTRGRRTLEMNGHEILIGRNSRENDDLTFHVASGDDFWLHAADYSGSHVIVRNPSRESELDGAVLLRAAQLAAYHSQARNSNTVDVHYTLKKFVKKPRRAKPGLVQLKQFKTITVEPRNWNGNGA